MTFCRRELCAAAAPFAQKFTPDLTGVKENGTSIATGSKVFLTGDVTFGGTEIFYI